MNDDKEVINPLAILGAEPGGGTPPSFSGNCMKGLSLAESNYSESKNDRW